jgi:hypothetical protein
MKTTIKFYSLLILTFLTLIPAIHKLVNPIPAEWFIGLFKNSPINMIPGGLFFAYWILIILEFACGLLFTISIVSMEFKPTKTLKFGKLGFHLTFILFIILFFGSFLIQNYDNGFNDFLYFVGVLFIYERYFKD